MNTRRGRGVGGGGGGGGGGRHTCRSETEAEEKGAVRERAGGRRVDRQNRGREKRKEKRKQKEEVERGRGGDTQKDRHYRDRGGGKRGSEIKNERGREVGQKDRTGQRTERATGGGGGGGGVKVEEKIQGETGWLGWRERHRQLPFPKPQQSVSHTETVFVL